MFNWIVSDTEQSLEPFNFDYAKLNIYLNIVQMSKETGHWVLKYERHN